MLRQELLRRMDQKQEELVKQIESLGREILEFKEGERVPKWARVNQSQCNYFRSGKWYEVIGKFFSNVLIIRNENGDIDTCHLTRDLHTVGEWELCYDDQPPVEKKCAQGSRKLGPEELIQTGDIVVWEDQSICSMEWVEDLAGIPTSSLWGYPKTLAIRPK